MPNYRRAFVPGGSFFFTLVTNRRKRFLCDIPARPLLGNIIRRCCLRWPMTINAIVLLPDHLHTIWSLPSGDSSYPKRWGWLKKEFTKEWLQLDQQESAISAGRQRERRRGVWQPRYWEHTLEDETDFERHFDYIHYNPVKHGLVKCPRDWPWSSFHRWVTAGVYPNDWACWKNAPPMTFDEIADTVGE